MNAYNKNNTPQTNHYKEIKLRADLVQFIESDTNTKPVYKGKNIFFNPCPFCSHKDCFYVFGDDRDAYYCQSCEAKGDIFTFVENYSHKTKYEALNTLAQEYNVDISQKQSDAAQPKENALQKMLNAAVDYYHNTLLSRPDILEYITSPKPNGRGHTLQTIKSLNIGFADGNMATSLQKKGFSLDKIKASGLYVEKKDKAGNGTGQWKDFFCNGVLVFPHKTELGDIGHFTIKDPKKKVDYQLRSENRLNGLLFGNQKAIECSSIITVEGENDLASFADAGFRNVLATLGPLNDKQLQWLLARVSNKKVITWFDYDIKEGSNGQPPAGIKYTRKLYRHLLKNDDCQVVVASNQMPPGDDPDDWIQKDLSTANKRIQAAITKAVHPLLWEIQIMPSEVKENAGAVLQHLEQIEFFDLMGNVPEIQRDAIIIELQKLGFARETLLNNITQSYGLPDILEDFEAAHQPAALRSEAYMRGYANRIWSFYRDRGKFFIGSEDGLHLFYQHKIYKIGDNQKWKALLHRDAKLNFTTILAKFVNEELKSKCLNQGEQMKSFSWIHLVEHDDDKLLYMNLKDPMNRVMRLSPGKVEMTENGTNEHSVLLADSSHMKPFTFNPDVNVRKGMEYMRELVFDSMACDPAQKYLVIAWALSSFIIPLSESKALMKMEGGSGSGKTTAAKFLSLMIYGESLVGRSTTASDFSMGSTEPLIIKDNFETDDINKNALNFLLLAATGAQNMKRSSGTESGVTSETLNCLVAITAIEPFAKPELINRTYIVNFSKKHQNLSFLETSAVLKLKGCRDTILSAWLTLLAEKVLTDLSSQQEIIAYMQKQHTNFSKDRTIEFLSLLTLITKSLLKYVPLPPELIDQAGNRAPEYVLLDSWINYQNQYATRTEVGTNMVLQLLNGIKSAFLMEFSKNANESRDSVMVPVMGIEVKRVAAKTDVVSPTENYDYSFVTSTKDLLLMMQRHARDHGIKVPFKTSMQLGVRMSNEQKTLQADGWDIQRQKTLRGTRYSTFSWNNYK